MVATLASALKSVCHTLTADAAQGWAEALIDPMTKGGLTTPRREAAFLGQIVQESSEFRDLIEDLDYSAERLCAVWPAHFPTLDDAESCAGNPVALADRVYAGRLGNTEPGDGWRFRGGGLIQITGRWNYASFGRTCGKSAEETADWVQTTKEGAVAASLYFWGQHHLNALADAWEITAITRIVNGSTFSAQARLAYSNQFVRALS